MGGEFNLAGNGNGSEWIMHAKSGYTAYRVPVAAAKDYYHVQIQVSFRVLIPGSIGSFHAFGRMAGTRRTSPAIFRDASGLQSLLAFHKKPRCV